MDLGPRDRYLIVLPLFHVGALTPVVSAMHCGTSVVLMRQFDPVAMWDIIENERIATTLAVPAMLNFMLTVPDFEKRDLSALRNILSGASPVPVALIEKYKTYGIEIEQEISPSHVFPSMIWHYVNNYRHVFRVKSFYERFELFALGSDRRS